FPERDERRTQSARHAHLLPEAAGRREAQRRWRRDELVVRGPPGHRRSYRRRAADAVASVSQQAQLAAERLTGVSVDEAAAVGDTRRTGRSVAVRVSLQKPQA